MAQCNHEPKPYISTSFNVLQGTWAPKQSRLGALADKGHALGHAGAGCCRWIKRRQILDCADYTCHASVRGNRRSASSARALIGCKGTISWRQGLPRVKDHQNRASWTRIPVS